MLRAIAQIDYLDYCGGYKPAFPNKAMAAPWRSSMPPSDYQPRCEMRATDLSQKWGDWDVNN